MRVIRVFTAFFCAVLFFIPATEQRYATALARNTNPPSATQIRTLKITILSTMLVGNPAGLGEWGFSALVEADGHRVLLDTGAHPKLSYEMRAT